MFIGLMILAFLQLMLEARATGKIRNRLDVSTCGPFAFIYVDYDQFREMRSSASTSLLKSVVDATCMAV